ncbi:MAG: 4-alpha-glucanotransferase, partial [Gemmatimonadota bacterium]
MHQPVGNFEHVFREHVDEVYRPFLERVAGRGLLPITLHVSGPLLEWLEANDSGYLDLVGRLVADGDAELLLSGRWEPILAALPRRDRREQVDAMREALRRRFGVEPTGLWLTERVWEPGLAADLAAAGVRYVLVDDRHLLVAGFERSELDRPFVTEADGRALILLPIDERLRYLVPFRPPDETTSYLRERRAAGAPLAVLGDDGEKFGGWPDTREWVYGAGWLERFIDALQASREAGEIRLVTTGEAAALPPAGLAYPAGGSYREMEEWTLRRPRALRLEALRAELGEDRLRGADGTLVRGGQWKEFFAKYPEANRMHKTMLALSTLCRERGDP